MRSFLLTELIRRDLGSRFAGSYAGPVWALLHPAVQCLLYSVVFSVFLRIEPPAGFRAGYVEFLLAGLLPWLGLSEALMRGTNAVTDQGHLVKKLRFPVELLPLSALLTALVLQIVALTVLVAWGVASGRADLNPGLMAAALLFQTLILVGPVLAGSALNVFFRDLGQALPPLLSVGFYLTPILYPESMVPAGFAGLLAVNPLRDVIGLWRAALFGAPAPPPLRLALWAVVFVVLGFLAVRLFRRCERSFSDLL